jgi:hypothetical protein
MSKHLTPECFGQAGQVCGSVDMLKQGAIEPLCNTIQLRCVMCGKSAGHTCGCEVFIKGFTQEFAPVIRVQDLDSSAVPLHDCLLFKQLVGIKRP